MVDRASDNPFPSVLFAEHVDPSNPPAGHQRLFVDTDHSLKLIDSAGTVTALTGGFTDPMTTRGDLIYRNASNVTARLGRGSAGQVLQSDGTDLAWATPSAGFSDPMTTRGDIIIRNSSNATARLGRGSAGQVLQSDGTDIAWATPAAASSDYVRLGETVLGSAAANATVTGISGSYRDLICVIKARSAQSGIDTVRIQVGSGSIDTGSHYAHWLFINGTDANAGIAAISATSSFVGYIPSAGLASNIFATGEVHMIDYVSASHQKSFQWKLSFYSQADNWTDVSHGGGSWNQTTAIDQVRIITGSGSNLATGTRLTVYGRA